MDEGKEEKKEVFYGCGETKIPRGGRLKALAKEYNLPPFFFKERRGDEERMVAWTSDLRQMKRVFYRILERFSPRVEVLLKIKGAKEEKDWERYHAKTSRLRCLRVIKSLERSVFQDGCTQLCVKRSDSEQYMVFDEHGILFIYYPNTNEFEGVLKQAGFQERTEKLISNSGHWHIIPKDAAALRNRFVKGLALKPVAEDDSAPGL